jgi:adenylate cyclase
VLLVALLYFAGRPEEGLERIQQAIRINSHHPYNYAFHLGQAYFVLGRYREAIEAFERGLSGNPSAERLHVWLAATLAQAGDIESAQCEAEQVLMLNPEFSVQRMKKAVPFTEPGEIEHFNEGLAKAGLGE